MKRFILRLKKLLRVSASRASASTTKTTSFATCFQPCLPQALRASTSSLLTLEAAEEKAAYIKRQVNAPLEQLPPEVRREILFTLPLDELRALVHASPVFHDQYRLDRKSIITQSIGNTFRSTAVDVCAVYKTSSAEFAKHRSVANVIGFLQSYENRRSSPKYSIHAEELTEGEAVSIANYYFSIYKHLATRYADWALTSLAKETNCSQIDLRLSRMEEARLRRAVYRFQLCCNLFGSGQHSDLLPLQSLLDEPDCDIPGLFLRTFEPWEVEEIVCIWAFAKDTVDRVFSVIQSDVDHMNPPPTPDEAFDLGSSYQRCNLLKATASCGLELLYTLLFEIRDHAHLVSTMRSEIKRRLIVFLDDDDALYDLKIDQRRQQWRTDRDLKMERRDPLPFEGDDHLDADEPQPPRAWTQIWGGTYSNLYGWYIPAVFRDWGYVMWDAARIETTGATEVLKRLWYVKWADDDPRETES